MDAQPFPANGGKYQISKTGGAFPVWRSDGKELFHIAPDSRLMAVALDTTRNFEAGIPHPLFTVNVGVGFPGRQGAVAKDGKRFLLNILQQQSSTMPITVVVNC